MERILGIWPTLSALAADLKLPYPTVAAWRQRGSIPAKHDLDLIEAAKLRGHELSLRDLAQMRRDPSNHVREATLDVKR
jgi:hypothetical protein